MEPTSPTINLSSGLSRVASIDEVERNYQLVADVGSLEHAERLTTADGPPNHIRNLDFLAFKIFSVDR
jgi:hypothetical protein